MAAAGVPSSPLAETIGQTNASRLRGQELRAGKPGRGSIERQHGDVIILILRVNQPVHETRARFPVRRLGEHLRGHAGGSNAGVGERGDGASVRDVVVMPKREVRFAHDQVRDRHGPARLRSMARRADSACSAGTPTSRRTTTEVSSPCVTMPAACGHGRCWRASRRRRAPATRAIGSM